MLIGQAVGPGGQLGPWRSEYATSFVTSKRKPTPAAKRAAPPKREAAPSSPAPWWKRTPTLVVGGLALGALAYVGLRKRRR